MVFTSRKKAVSKRILFLHGDRQKFWFHQQNEGLVKKDMFPLRGKAAFTSGNI